ncbi:MAG: hypothetical protein K2N54_04720 [Helicobacter sp.]|nr:hypothetical protein [Helicobacter sp.]
MRCCETTLESYKKSRYVSLRASVTSVAINNQRIPSEHSKTVDCFASLAMTDC